jgi:hypothetical protein
MDQNVTFARGIRPLVSDRDVGSMSSCFDLSSYDDVRANAKPIYERLANGTMPCYGPWPADNVERFRTFVGALCCRGRLRDVQGPGCNRRILGAG